jgi:prolyl oligopeptidase
MTADNSMTDLFLERDDDPATRDFVDERNAVSQEALDTPAMRADTAALQQMMERDDRLILPTRRGDWLFDFRRSRDNPLGVWRRLPADRAPTHDADWETVFDLDAFCATEGKRWIYGGAVTCPWEPTRVLLRLSDGGSDLVRLLEFDAEAKQIVSGGFDLPAVRAHANWLSRDEICYFGAIDEFSATLSGWPRVGRRLARGDEPQAGSILYEAARTDVYGYATVIDPAEGDGKSATGGADPDLRQIRLFFAGHQIGKMSIHVEEENGALRKLDLPVDIEADLNHSHCLWLAKSDEAVAAGSLVLQRLTPFGSAPLDVARRIISPAAEGRSIRQFRLMRDHAVWVVEDRLVPTMFVMDLSDTRAEPVQVALPDGVESVSFSTRYADLHLGDDSLWVVGQGFLVPPTRYLLDLSEQRAPLALKEPHASPAYFDAEGMTSALLEAVSEDGTRVPYHLVLPKAFQTGELPVLIYGYGGFAASLGPHYSGTTGRWLEQGGAYVQAYIRGGSELGPQWHTVAKREGRHKAFEDFVAIARDLVKRGYTKPSRIACTGASNGGLLSAVMLTRYPQDFGAVWCRVPVIDMTRFQQFPAGRAWIDEYGDPDEDDDRRFLLAYSPLEAIRHASDQTYPALYIESSSNDDRVHPSHARRFALRLEHAGHRPLFHEFGSGGHGGAGNSAEMARRTAMGYSFLRRAIVDQS